MKITDNWSQWFISFQILLFRWEILMFSDIRVRSSMGHKFPALLFRHSCSFDHTHDTHFFSLRYCHNSQLLENELSIITDVGVHILILSNGSYIMLFFLELKSKRISEKVMFPLSLQIYKLLQFFRIPYTNSRPRAPCFPYYNLLWKKRIHCKVHSFNMHELLRAYMHVIHIYSPYIFCVHPHLIF